MARYLIRGGTPADERDVLALAHHLNTVNLPDDPAQVREILELSRASFAEEIEDPRRREFVFVLEDVAQRRVVGTSKVIAQLGRRDAPYIYFDVFTDEKYSSSIDEHFVHTVLRIGYSYNGPTEIGGLIVLPESRSVPDRVGLMISYVRFAFIALHRAVFRDEVVAELLPPLELDGTSRLWEALGRHFTRLSYLEADLLSKRNKEFIRTLFPSGDIYASILPRDAQAVIGKVGKETRGVEKMLRRIGFSYCHRIDPFDGGPHFRAPTDEISLVRATRTAVVSRVVSSLSAPKSLVIAERSTPPFLYAVATPVAWGEDGSACLLAEDAALLDVSIGSSIAVLPID